MRNKCAIYFLRTIFHMATLVKSNAQILFLYALQSLRTRNEQVVCAIITEGMVTYARAMC